MTVIKFQLFFEIWKGDFFLIFSILNANTADKVLHTIVTLFMTFYGPKTPRFNVKILVYFKKVHCRSLVQMKIYITFFPCYASPFVCIQTEISFEFRQGDIDSSIEKAKCLCCICKEVPRYFFHSPFRDN